MVSQLETCVKRKKKIGKKKRKSSISMAVFKTFWPLSREPLVQLAQFKACWMRNFQDIKLVGQSKLSRGPEVARGPEVEYHCPRGLPLPFTEGASEFFSVCCFILCLFTSSLVKELARIGP